MASIRHPRVFGDCVEPFFESQRIAAFCVNAEPTFPPVLDELRLSCARRIRLVHSGFTGQ
jgi:hypothetical protein